MDNPDFDFEFTSEVPNVSDDLKLQVLNRLESLAAGKNDLIGAAVAIRRLAHGETPHLFQARIVAYFKPANLVAHEKADNVEQALREALKTIERQVRKQREKVGTPWKRPDMDSQEDTAVDL